MDGQHHNAPEQFFATPDGAPGIPDEDHATAILGTSMEADRPSFSLSSYDSLAPVGQIQSHHQQQPQQQQQQQSSYLESSGSAVSVSPHYAFNAASGSGPSIYQTSSNWQQDNQQLMFANTTSMSVPVPAHDALSSFNYEAYDEGQANVHIEDAAMSHGHRFVAPMDTALQLGYGYNWDAQDATVMEFEPSPLQSPTGYTSMPVSPSATGTGTGTETPTSYASSSSGGQYPAMYTGANLQAQAASVMGDAHVGVGVGENERESTPMPKRARTRTSLSRSNRPSLQTGPLSSNMPSSNIRGEGSMAVAGPSSTQAHRSSSHTTPRQAEKKEEKKTRSSHNLVEKQYRNRLNAQFEGLMNALPESLRAQGASLGSLGAMGEGGEGVASDTPERKPSKAEVLEMARTHIRSLEQERDSLMDERDGLLGDIDRLQKLIESQSTEEDDAAAP